jgi:hypothetical protein
LLRWWVDLEIITNKRVITCKGFIQPTRSVIALEKISQVAVHQDSPWSTFLRYGDVYIYTGGDRHILKRVYRPDIVRDNIHGIHQGIKAAAAAKGEKLPTIVDPELKDLLTRLGKKDEVPSLPNADEGYEQWLRPEQLRKPLRRFGGPLRIPTEVTYAAEEKTVMYIQRSKWILFGKLFFPGLGCLVALFLTFLYPGISLFTVCSGLILLAVMALLTINYVDDIFILTNKRIINIERKFIFLNEERVETAYENIHETTIKITNLVQNFLDVGNIYIKTKGTNPDINMTLVDNPYFIADKINEIKGFEKKVGTVKSKNERQDELSKWFTNVISVLEKKMSSQGVPNLRSMDFWTASTMAETMGMKVVPVGEDDSYPHIEAGRVVSQNPMPGTLIAVDPDARERPQIHVILSKRG